jgi:hypothetical protein
MVESRTTKKLPAAMAMAAANKAGPASFAELSDARAMGADMTRDSNSVALSCFYFLARADQKSATARKSFLLLFFKKEVLS